MTSRSLLFLSGVVQGMITGIRGLCNGLGPALYGFVFYLFHVELNEMAEVETMGKATKVMVNPTDEVSYPVSSLALTVFPLHCINHSCTLLYRVALSRGPLSSLEHARSCCRS